MALKKLLIRVDDAGIDTDTNRGVEAALRASVAKSVGIMACAPCFQDAVERLKALPFSVSIGVHLTLNSEWIGYRWKPLLPMSEVPSLVDDDGFLPCNHQLYRERPPLLDHVLAELRAQIAAVRAAGLKPCYADEHMVFSASSPWMLDPIRELVETAGLIYDRAVRLPGFRGNAETVDSLQIGLVHTLAERAMLVTHPAENGPHMRTMHYANTAPGEPARSRAAELATLTDPRLSSLLEEHGVQPIGYKNLL